MTLKASFKLDQQTACYCSPAHFVMVPLPPLHLAAFSKVPKLLSW